jgi:DNA-binding NtrC family response regulator
MTAWYTSPVSHDLDDPKEPTPWMEPTKANQPKGDDAQPSSDAVRLVILQQGAVPRTVVLGPGRHVLGRSPDVDVSVDEVSMSRRHATLVVGPRLFIEDCGSLNGIRVGDVHVAPGESMELLPGDGFELGQAAFIVQRRAASRRAPRVRPHAYFEARLDEECGRALRQGSAFTVARFHVEPRPEVASLDTALAEALQDSDIVGEYGPGELEVLFVDAPFAAVQGRCQAFVQALRAHGHEVLVQTVDCPGDGMNACALIDAANAALDGDTAPHTGALVEGSAMQRLRSVVARVASSHLSIVLHGETGTGKEVFARHIHEASDRSKKPFVGINCASLGEALLESELFGYERGAFSGATAAKPGLFEVANGGTVLLDEIGEMTLAVQAKMLRTLEERTVLRVGGLSPRPIDVRFLAASHKDLEAEVAAGRFRQDLLYRLNGITLEIPPLRERIDEVEGLARLFLVEALRRRPTGEPAAPPPLTADAWALLKGYAWPGNIRELRNIMERAVLLSGGGKIGVEHLPAERMRAPSYAPSPAAAPPPKRPTVVLAPHDDDDELPTVHLSRPRAEAVTVVGGNPMQEENDAERARILGALEQAGGNQTRAAQALGISRRTLLYRLDSYGVPRPRKPG